MTAPRDRSWVIGDLTPGEVMRDPLRTAGEVKCDLAVVEWREGAIAIQQRTSERAVFSTRPAAHDGGVVTEPQGHSEHSLNFQPPSASPGEPGFVRRVTRVMA